MKRQKTTPMRRAWPAVALSVGLLSVTVSGAGDAETGPVQAKLDALKAESSKQVPADVLAAGEQGNAELLSAGVLEKALAKGDAMAPFTLNDAHGRPVSSASLLAKGPMVVVFYRGAWCPFCNLYLRSVQEYLPDIEAAGATLVAISGEKPDRSLSVEQTNTLTFPVLSDPDLTVARQFGLAYELPQVVDEAVSKLGFDMRKYYGTEKVELPLSATYVIDPSGKVAYAFVTVDYKRRAEPEDFLAVLSDLKTKQ